MTRREEAWNCNRCRDRRLIVWNGVETPCDRCAARIVAVESDITQAEAEAIKAALGSLPLREGQTDGGAGAPEVGGPSHDTEPRSAAFGPYADQVSDVIDQFLDDHPIGAEPTTFVGGGPIQGLTAREVPADVYLPTVTDNGPLTAEAIGRIYREATEK